MERLLRLNPSLRVANTLVTRRIRRPEDIVRWTNCRARWASGMTRYFRCWHNGDS
jgi:hypothetical protein